MAQQPSVPALVPNATIIGRGPAKDRMYARMVLQSLLTASRSNGGQPITEVGVITTSSRAMHTLCNNILDCIREDKNVSLFERDVIMTWCNTQIQNLIV